MKTVLEFGIRGGYHIDNIVLPSAKLAAQIAASLANVFTEHQIHNKSKEFEVNRRKPRITWTSGTHFVAVSLLDGTNRGPASTKLWRKEKEQNYDNSRSTRRLY